MNNDNTNNQNQSTNTNRTLIIKSIPSGEFEEESKQRLRKSVEGKKVPHVINFENPEKLRKIFTEKRLELIKKIQELEPDSIRDLARKIDRGLREVHGDLKLLAEYDIVQFEKEGKSKRPVVPYEQIDVQARIGKSPGVVRDKQVEYPEDVDNENEVEPVKTSLVGELPEDVLEDDILHEYNKSRDRIGRNLRFLNSNIEFLKRIFDFDWSFFGGPTHLFGYLRDNIYYYSVIVCYKIWDNNSDAADLNCLKNITWNNLKKEEYRENLGKDIKQLKNEYNFSVRIEPVIEKLKDYRDKLFAHIDLKEITHETNILETHGDVKIEDLELVADYSSEFFHLLSFGIHTDLSYKELFKGNEGEFGGGELNNLLEAIAVTSSFSVAYEKSKDDGSPNMVQKFLKEYPKDKIDQLNRIREEFGLEPIQINE